MNALKYLHSQKGKVIEKMKIAFLSGKHIVVIEKLEEALLKEIIQESSIIPFRSEVKNQGGLTVGNTPSSSVQFVDADNFIDEKPQNLPDTATLYIYKCKDAAKTNSPQISSTSTLPDQSIGRYLNHISGLSALLLQTSYAKQLNALNNSMILLITNTQIDIPSKYTPFVEYIRVPFIEIDEFSEKVSEIIHSLDDVELTETEKGYNLINKPDSVDYLSSLYNNMKGLNLTHIKSILHKTKIVNGCIYTENNDIKKRLMSFVRDESNKIISLSNSLSILDTSDSTEPAGLGNMSEWITNNKRIIKDSSQYEFMEMTSPKGILVSGIPGTGKSMMAKYIAKELDLPLVRFDLGDLLGGYVGDSERNMNESLVTIDALSPCVVWIDEMEKAFNSSHNSHETTKRLIGKFLTWMQEKKSCSFVFATANDTSNMPPEMFRSGRFDEKFYTFLPSSEDCGKIFESTILRQNESHRRKTSCNFEAKPLFSNDINAKIFVKLLNQEGLCIKEKQDFSDNNITRKNKFFIGSDIAKLIEDAKALYIRQEGFTNHFNSKVFIECLKKAIEKFKSYGETNLDDIAKCYSQLARKNFTSACRSESVILPFDGYDELRCSKGEDIYSYSKCSMECYDQQMFISVRNTLNSLGKSLLSNY